MAQSQSSRILVTKIFILFGVMIIVIFAVEI